MNQCRLMKVPSQCLYSVHSTAKKPRKELIKIKFSFKKEIELPSTNASSVSDDLLNASSCSNIVEEPKFKSI